MINYRVELIPTAVEGLINIGEYIAIDNPTRAINFIDEITNSLMNTLSVFPLSGRITNDLNRDEEIRMLPYKNYKSYYRVKEDQQLVEILFVFNSNQNMNNSLQN